MHAPQDDSPFHAGEQAVQERAGVRERAERLGRHMIRDHLTDQHRAFFGALPFVFIGGIDRMERPWASPVFGQPGFLSAPSERRLELRAPLLPGDPLTGAFEPGDALALLGIHYETRRRNRLSTRVHVADAAGFELDIVQTFGNCPQYIQARTYAPLRETRAPGVAPRSVVTRFDERTRTLIASADNFTIATCHADAPGAASNGADVSHRGGAPGFIRVIDEETFEFPDYPGNNHFNTLGNLARNPRAGVTFIDFESGDVLYLSGTAKVVWDAAVLPGAERIVRFHCTAGLRLERALPLQFEFVDYAPRLPAVLGSGAT